LIFQENIKFESFLGFTYKGLLCSEMIKNRLTFCALENKRLLTSIKVAASIESGS